MILYGQGKCFIKYNVAPIENVSIYYDGDVTLLHNYMLIHKIKANTITFKNNLQANNLLIEDVGQIHIGFINLNKSDFLLFDYKGFFKVNKALINNKRCKVEILANDVYEHSQGKWEDDDIEYEKSDKNFNNVITSKAKTPKIRVSTNNTTSKQGY